MKLYRWIIVLVVGCQLSLGVAIAQDSGDEEVYERVRPKLKRKAYYGSKHIKKVKTEAGTPEARKEQNRKSAQKFRVKKKRELEKLRKENERLRQELQKIKSKESISSSSHRSSFFELPDCSNGAGGPLRCPFDEGPAEPEVSSEEGEIPSLLNWPGLPSVQPSSVGLLESSFSGSSLSSAKPGPQAFIPPSLPSPLEGMPLDLLGTTPTSASSSESLDSLNLSSLTSPFSSSGELFEVPHMHTEREAPEMSLEDDLLDELLSSVADKLRKSLITRQMLKIICWMQRTGNSFSKVPEHLLGRWSRSQLNELYQTYLDSGQLRHLTDYLQARFRSVSPTSSSARFVGSLLRSHVPARRQGAAGHTPEACMVLSCRECRRAS